MVGSRRFYYGWLVVGSAAAAEFANAATAISILTLFVTPMSAELGWSRTEIAGATSLGALLGAGLAPWMGRLVDRLGARWPLGLGSVAVALGCLGLATAHTLLGFYAAFTLARIADQGVIKIGAQVTAGKWFRRYRGRATALVVFAGSMGIVVLAPVTQLAIGAWGWRAAWLLLGGVMLVVGAVPTILLVRRQPEDLGLQLDGLPLPPASQPGRFSGTEEEKPWMLREVMRTSTFWVVLLSLFLVASAGSGVQLHLMPHLTQQGLSAGQAVGAISLMFTAGAVSSVVWGLMAERWPPLWLLFFACLLQAASMGILIFADTLAETYLFALCQGVASTGVNTLLPLLWVSYYGRATLGAIHGLGRGTQVVGFAIGPLLSGLVYDTTGSYQQAFVFYALVAAGSALLLLLARRPQLPAHGLQSGPREIAGSG